MFQRYTTLFAFLVAALIGIWCLPLQSTEVKKETQKQPSISQKPATGLKPIVSRSLRNGISIPLRDMKPIPIKRAPAHERENEILPKALASAGRGGGPSDPVVDNGPVKINMPAPFQSFDGGSDDDNQNVVGFRVVPPDTEGDVGPNHYVQYINLIYDIYDKNGNLLLGPIAGNAFWQGLGGTCETHNDGDPIVLYDHLADRWMVSQFALFSEFDGGNHQCIAISQTSDPTGAWFQYDFLASATKINDYPHFGVWPDAYYMTANQFTGGFAGAGVWAFERDKMLIGAPAQMVYFDLFGVNPNFGGMLPSDLDGPAPPAGAPNIYMEVDDSSVFGTDRLSLWEFHVDWAVPANSTFGIGGNPNLHLDTAPFDWDLCGFSRSCIPQPSPGEGLDAISDRLMYRIQYRNFGGYRTLVTNHTVDVDGTDHAGVRWYELRDDGSGWAIHQQGTWAPDSDNRWMGSAAMDSAGNIAVGYSVSSASTFPSVRYAGRLSSDPPGDLTQGEAVIHNGTGSQTASVNRWGDYSMLTVDQSPGSAGGIDCDFWYTNEYYQNTGSFDFNTRVGAFTFAPGACGGPHGDLNGTITDASTTNPIQGAKVTIQPGGFTTTTDASGFYHFTLAVGSYDVTASAYGYFSQTANGVNVTDGGTTVQDFALQPAPIVNVSGTVTDGSGHGWPLYAQIDITGYPGGPVFTNPATGAYSVNLVQDNPYTFNVHAISPGYSSESRPVIPPAGGSTENFLLTVDSSCTAPGYGITGGVSEAFESGTTPPGWSVLNNGSDADMVWVFNDPGGRGNLTGGTGGFAIADSDHFGCCGDPEDTELRTPVLNFSGVSDVHIEFDSDFFWYPFSMDEKGDVDVSTDGGTTWTNVFRYQGANFRGPRHENIDVSALAGNQSNVMVRFHYYDADFEFWWEVDNVRIGAQCTPIPGGLLVGNVFDINTGLGLNGAKITSDDHPTDTTTSFSTPVDPSVDEGFYILFSSLTGAHNFTASKNLYGTDTQTPTIVADAVVVQDFHLGAGFLVVTPNPLEATVPLGTQSTVPLNISNTGTAPADFELQEGNGHTAGPSRGSGAPVNHIKGNFSPFRFGFTPKTKIKSEGANVPAAVPAPKAPPWTDIANYPSNIMDNTCAEVDGKIYCVGGFDGFAILNTGNVYDSGSNSWSAIASMTAQREKPAVAAIDGKLYVVGGWDEIGTPDPTLEIYDPGSNTWSSGASVPAAFGGGPAGVNLDGKFYVIGGCTAFSCGVTNVEVYDPSANSWSSAADYPEPTSWLACGAISGQIFCAGGIAASSSKHTYVYDPGSNSWSSLADVPQDQWAMGYIASDDILYISGGVTDNFSTITNEGFAYDPSTNAWTPIANSNNTLYRGGSACGFYKIGGSIGGFSPVPDSEVLPGLTNCGGVVDVPWLSEDPTAGTVPNGSSQIVNVTFDATAISQPGDYLAHLRVKTNTPTAVPDEQITMHVPLPPDWGTLEGTVNALGRCDAAGGPLADATVFVDTGGTDYTLKTDASGHYQVSFLASDSPVIITVSASGYVSQTRSGVIINAQQITTENFDMRLDAPCANKSPASFDVTLSQGSSSSSILMLINAGAGMEDFLIRETLFALPPLVPFKPLVTTSKTIAAAPIGPNSFRSMKPKGAPAVPVPQNTNWFLGSPLPGGIVRYAHAQCDTDPNSFYVISGVDGTFNVTANAWRYDATTNTWNALAPIPTGQEGPAAACYQGKIYVVGGGGTNQMFIYDIGTDTWSTGASLPRAVWGPAVGAWTGKVYMIGGDSDFFIGGTSTEVDVYDIATNTWTGTGTPMPTAAVTPGFVQAGPYVYIAGGWNDSSPASDVSASQRYDMSTNTWTTGPNLNHPRADLALTITDTALYAIGGDKDGGGFFEASNDVERLAWAGWPGGAWADLGDPIPIAVTANNAGFCTEAIHIFGTLAEFWSVGGLNTNFVITGNNAFHGVNEHCFSIFTDVPWLSESPASGTVAPDSTSDVNVGFDSSGLNLGDYNAVLVVTTNDPGASEFNIPVTLHVVAACGTITLDDTLPDGNVKKPYNGTIIASGGTGPYTFALSGGSLPPGLTLNANGTVTGTPTNGGIYNFQVTATDANGCTGSRSYTVKIKGKK